MTQTLYAQSKGPDFDGDGLSDVAAFENQHDGSPNELVVSWVNSSDGAANRTEYGKSTQASVPSDYDGDGKTDLAIVGPNDAGEYQWTYKLSSGGGVETSDLFGKKDDLVLFGCNFDLDGKADRAVMDLSGVLVLQKSSDLSSSSFSIPASVERVICADINGDGIDEIIGQQTIKAAAEPAKKKSRKKKKPTKKPTKKPGKQPSLSKDKSYFYVWNLSGEKIQELDFGKGVKSIFVADTDGDGIKEIGYDREKSGSVKEVVFYNAGAEKVYTFPYFTKIVFQNFTSSAPAIDGAFVKTKTSNKFLKFPSLSDTNSFQEFFIERTDTVITNKGTTNVGPVVSKETECNVHLEAFDGNEGFLWKPVSDTTGNSVVALPSQYSLRNVRIIKSGQTVETLRSGGNGNGGRDHWRSMRRASTFDDFITVVGSKAGTNYCWLIEDPKIRVD